MRHVHRWLPSIGPPLDCFPEGLLYDPLMLRQSMGCDLGIPKQRTHQTMQLVISF